jgi:two-component system sensor histidine kinase AlgZ
VQDAESTDEAPRSRAIRFDVCHAGLALRAVLYVQAVLAVVTLLGSGSVMQALTLTGPVIMGGLLATLSWLLLMCLLRRVLAAIPGIARMATAMALGGATALLARAVLLPFSAGSQYPVHGLGLALGGALLGATVWTWLELRVRSRLPAEATARLAELQARIRPHFLFNALNTAVALVRIDPSRAESVLEDLSQLFRVALENQGEAVTLADEVDLARRYLAIEQVRFGDRLRVSWHLEPDAGLARVPPLLLQPLVENAVRHGIEPASGGGHIALHTRVRRGQAVVVVVNTVPPEPSAPGHGMALENVRERLRLLHDVEAGFEARLESGLFRVKIEVPL